MAVSKITCNYEEFGVGSFAAASGFSFYSTSGDANTPGAIKAGRVVHLQGAFTATSARTTSGTTVLGWVPARCIPAQRVTLVQHGSSQVTFLLYINTDGSISMDRYNANGGNNIPNGAWINVSAVYISKK